MKWEDDIIALEEICVNGYMFGCTYGVTGDVVPEATCTLEPTSRRKVLACHMQAEKFAAECLTEPRGGSDFFGSTTYARKRW